MTSRPSRLGSANYEVETAWAEATDTFGTRIELLGEPIMPTGIQDRISQPTTKQYANEGILGVRGPWKGSFTVKVPFVGHGSTTAGALTETPLYALLENVFGWGNSAQVGGDVDAAPTSASQFALATGTAVAGALLRVGTIGDGRGNGQFACVNSAATITLKTALDATPIENDITYAAQMIYPAEGPANFTAIASTRWLLQTANGQWKARGCFPTSISFSGMQTGEIPSVDITYGVSRWEEANETFPDATAVTSVAQAVIAGGSCFLQDVGTVTRQTFSHRSWSLNIDLQVQPEMGPSGADAYQIITGAVRNELKSSISITAPAEASGTNTFNDIFTGSALQHCLMSLSVSDGSALGFYFPNMRATNYVTQESTNGLNSRTLNLEALTDTSSANGLVSSSIRIAMG